jgi:D-xylose transport system substrate-binding protein
MKKFLVGVLVLMMLFSVVGCTSQPAAEDTETPNEEEIDEIIIGVSLPTLQEERWKKDEAMIKKELQSLGIKAENILIQSAGGNEQKQVTQCENLITQGIDVLIVIPQNGEALAPVVESAHEANVQVVSVDRIINNADLDFYVTFDAYEIGVVQAEYMIEKVDSGNWIMIGGAPTDPNAALIRQGQLSVLQPYIDSGQINVVLDQNANYWNPDEALLYTEQGLTANNNDIQCVFTSNDGCAGAAIVALEEQGLAGKVPVPGLDAELSAVKRIVQGTQSMTVYRKLEMQASIAAKAAYALASETSDVESVVGAPVVTKNNGFKDVPAVLLSSREVMFAVDKENVKVVVDDGWLAKEDIYGDLSEEFQPNW